MESKVDMLKKIAVTISPSEKTTAPKGSEPVFCEFIYGIGPQGLTPFEYAMAGKAVGDEFCIRISPSNVGETFQHLAVHIPEDFDDSPSVSYSIRIVDITSADNREIVGAMANLSACTGCCGH